MNCDDDRKINSETSGKPTGPCTMVIFGASGDLTKRKLIPALYNLYRSKLLNQNFSVIGFARREYSLEAFREEIKQDLIEYASVPLEEDFWTWFAEHLFYLSGNFDDSESYTRLKKYLSKIDQDHGTDGNYIYYLATGPEYFGRIVELLGNAKLTRETKDTWRRIIIEKPFGSDQDSAKKLNAHIQKFLGESQIFRIDHYLGKETVQNILVFRFANGIFEPIWNRQYIDHVQITVSEDLGIEQRGGYYDTAGALRDMVPNHIFQLITLIAMEPPISFEADAVRDEQSKVLRAIPPMIPEEVLRQTVRGQYGPAKVNKLDIKGYRSESRVASDSMTETFVAMKLNIDNWRWASVPIYLRTGKRMPKRVTEVAIQFKRAPLMLFRDIQMDRLLPNWLVIRIQPEEGIALSFGAKIPGPLVRLGTVDMDFQYKDYFGTPPSTGYERLLYDAMMGDATLFQRADMVEAGWAVVEPILDVWKALPPRHFPNYDVGSWGPQESAQLIRRSGRNWRLCQS